MSHVGRFTKALHQSFGDGDDGDWGLSPDYDHDQALQETGFWGRQGAGCLVLAQSTGRLLIPHRSEAVLEPGTWGVWGGAIDAGQSPSESVLRELKEEAGYQGQVLEKIPLYVFQDEGSGFKYSNFLVIVPEEFEPRLNWETEEAKWFSLDQLPDPKHFGLEALLGDRPSLTTIRFKIQQAHNQTRLK